MIDFCLKVRRVLLPTLLIAAVVSGCQQKPAATVSDPSSPHAIEKLDITHTLLIGSYTPAAPSLDADGKPLPLSEGIYAVGFDASTKNLGEPVLIAKTHNPSWLSLSPSNQTVYAVDEKDPGELNSFRWFSEKPRASLIDSKASGGASPCHAALSPDMQYLAVGNYMGGNLAVFKVDTETGVPASEPQLRQHRGNGPNKNRQEAPHAHWVGWNNTGDILYAVDLGIDTVMGYRFNAVNGELGEGFVAFKAAAGAGPRHMVFDKAGSHAYIVNELANTVSVVSVTASGEFVEQQNLSSLPRDFSEHSQSAHIQLSADGAHLYVSNRGHNSIAVFQVAVDGGLSLSQTFSTQGKWPRGFVLLDDAKVLFVVNEESNSLVLLDVNSDGLLSFSGRKWDLGQPTYIGLWQEK